MIHSLLAVAAGYISVACLNGFSRIIIALYFRTDISLSGITYLPSSIWGFAFTGLSFFYGVFGGLITSTLTKGPPTYEILCLLLLLATAGLFDYSLLNADEPLWYLISAPALKMAGVYTGYKLKILQDRQLRFQSKSK